MLRKKNNLINIFDDSNDTILKISSCINLLYSKFKYTIVIFTRIKLKRDVKTNIERGQIIAKAFSNAPFR